MKMLILSIILFFIDKNIVIGQKNDTNKFVETTSYTNLDLSTNDEFAHAFIGFGLGLKYFISSPEGKYFDNDPRYETDYCGMLNIGIPLSNRDIHFFISELKYYRTPIHSYGKQYNLYLITLLYRYKVKLGSPLSISPQIGFNFYSNIDKDYFFSNAIDLNVEYNIDRIIIFLKNGININLFSGARLPYFILSGINIKL